MLSINTKTLANFNNMIQTIYGNVLQVNLKWINNIKLIKHTITIYVNKFPLNIRYHRKAQISSKKKKNTQQKKDAINNSLFF